MAIKKRDFSVFHLSKRNSGGFTLSQIKKVLIREKLERTFHIVFSENAYTVHFYSQVPSYLTIGICQEHKITDWKKTSFRNKIKDRYPSLKEHFPMYDKVIDMIYDVYVQVKKENAKV